LAAFGEISQAATGYAPGNLLASLIVLASGIRYSADQ
jgi:hypothetical protein